MATKDIKPDGSKSLGAHKEPERLAAHDEPARLEAFKEIDEVPGVTDNVDSTPRVVKYGAAVLLGLAFGLGCYVWYSGGVPSYPQNPDGPFAAREEGYDYFNRANNYDFYFSDVDIPTPFAATAYSNDPQIMTPVAIIPSGGGSDAARKEVSSAAYGVAGPRAAATALPVVVYLFNYDSTEIPETAALTDMARRAADSGMTLDVKAYTDRRGRAAYNEKLSERRARAVADYLVAHGMPASKVRTHAMGPTDAFGSDAADRRAEVKAL